MAESLFVDAGLEEGAESFAQRARVVIARIDAGESAGAVAVELGELRQIWRRLDFDERDRLKRLATELSERTVPRVAPLRIYEGPRDPDALLAYFGLAEFRSGQREAVDAALSGRDASIVMPTGRGKSLCYTLPGLASEKLTVVVSPLIALMSDQYNRLRDAGHPAVMLASGMPEDHNRNALAEIRSGAARMVFCSPERFASGAFVSALADA